MSTPPPNPPADKFAAYVRWLTHSVVTRQLMGLLAGSAANHLVDRLGVAKQRFARLAARIAAGTFAPRRVAARRTPEISKPRPKIPRRQNFGWLRPLLPDAVPAAGYLEHLFQDPEMIALMQAAPAQTARIFRPICWMLRVKPPPILARPRRTRPPRAAPVPEAGPAQAAPPAPTAAPPIPPKSPPPRPPTQPPKAPPTRRARPAPPAPPSVRAPPRPA